MPKLVNHDDRRSELAEAVWSLIREQGLSGVTVRALSARSGWSSGAIRHYLPTREATLTFAAQQLKERFKERVGCLPLLADVRQNLLGFLQVMLPLDDDTRGWMEVWIAFVGEAVSNPAYADTQDLLYASLHGVIVDIFRDFEHAGWHLRYPPEHGAAQLHALLDGLSVHVLLGQVTPEKAIATLEQMVDDLLSPP